MEVRLHIGAHRTGTTRLQQALRRRASWLRDKRGLGVYWPEQVRPERNLGFNLKASLPAPLGRLVRSAAVDRVAALRAEAEAQGKRRMVVSEENWAGLIDQMIATGAIYPAIRRRIGALAPVFRGDRVTLLFSVREYSSFYASLYCHRTRTRPLPPFERGKQRYLALPRRWPAVLADLGRAMPDAEILVWPFETLRGNGGAALCAILGQDNIVGLNEALKPALPSPSAAAVARLNAMVSGPDLQREARIAVVKALADGPRFDPWTAEERVALQAAYEADLAELSAAPPGNVRLIDLRARQAEVGHG
ncbi:hypothetical protein HMH01_12840 [Halovulum dunhuangense]|uniref:Sulfotransferase family protein n=1 Tax=Halovulum dunhuangense TaxID=1505036 RepID=A0A849L4P5_9RHOB|nr:hypothetical protein [Halovulum dunhuangense]NNU81325.1 hypothetical protein [Halovulum dunhuangense]